MVNTGFFGPELFKFLRELKSNNNKHDKKVIQMYKDWIARECSVVQMPR